MSDISGAVVSTEVKVDLSLAPTKLIHSLVLILHNELETLPF